MRVPILYALTYPERLRSDLPKLDFTKIPTLNFTVPDKRKFRNLGLAYEALELGGNMPCILNAANESAVAAFLKSRVGFMQMSDVVEHAMARCSFEADPGLDHLEETDRMARAVADEYILKHRN
jgi:1-deoxy-D-xylulose-5-phosphate reductoisomerase